MRTEIFHFPERSNDSSLSLIDNEISDQKPNIPEILIVEDNLEMCQLLKTLLTKDYHLKFLYNGLDANIFLKTHIPELIIVDWMLPVMDGIELVQHIKRNPQTSFIPILMLTARKFLTDKTKALRVGVDDYIQKPFDSDELRLRISQMLQAKENRTEGLIQEYAFSSEIDEIQFALSSKDQLWLLELEEKLQPLLSDPELDMQKVAAISEFSTSKISRKIKRLTGFTGKRYIRELRLWKARQLLETGKFHTVKQVSYAVGFKNQRYFSRIFRERFGRYPSDY